MTTRRIGVTVPAGNVVHEREFAQLGLPGVQFHFSGFSYPPAGTNDFCADMAGNLRAPMRELKEWGAEVILVGCTTASMMCAGDDFTATLEAAAGVPVITAADATRQAARALGAQTLAVATPYGEPNNRIVAQFLSSQGFEIAAIAGLNLDRSLEVWRTEALQLTPQQMLEFSCTIDRPEADALYLPCTGVPSVEAIELFEQERGKSAFSSVQAGYWASLRRLGIDGRQRGYGRLIEHWDF
jgi:maleate cis-trans isomerase